MTTPKPKPPTLTQRVTAIEQRLDAIEASAKPAPTAPSALPAGWYDGGIWNWGARFAASEWAAPFSTIPWHYDHVSVNADGSVSFALEAGAGAEVQARDGTPAVTTGLFEIDVTLPKAREGVIQAPLWLYDKTTNSGDEIDFEVVGTKGMQLNLHANGQQDAVLILGDWSGRHRLAIRLGVGFVELSADGKLLHRYDASTSRLAVTHALKPMMSIWAVDPADVGMSSWAGKFAGFAPGEVMYMTVHGYRYTPL